MNRSESIKSIANALLVFDAEMGKINKEEINPFFKNKYAALPDILSAIKEPLIKAGLTLKQFPTGEHELTTIIIHASSGEFLESTYKMIPSKNDPQGEGSRITYQRRYAIGAALGLNIDIDDDGNKASVISPTGKPILTNAQFAKALARAKAGEHDVLKNLQSNFTMSQEQIEAWEYAINHE